MEEHTKLKHGTIGKTREPRAENPESDLGIRFYRCELCDYSTAWMTTLEWHVKYSHPAKKKETKLKCGACKFTSATEDSLKSHVECVHEKIKRFKCQMCGYATYRKANLISHIREVHEKIKGFKCVMCPDTFTRKYLLANHIKKRHNIIWQEGQKIDHTDSPPHKLEKDVLSQENLSRFMETVADKSDECTNAAASTQDEQTSSIYHLDMPKNENCEVPTDNNIYGTPLMNRHDFQSSKMQEQVEVERPSEDMISFKCPMCLFQTATKITYNQHLIDVHEIVEVFDNEYEEGISPEEDGGTKNSEVNHEGKGNKIEIATTKKPQQEKWELKCAKCSFTTRNGTQHLKEHNRRVHEGVLFKCDICGKTARRKGGIDDHKRRMHEGVKRFKCSLCDWANYEKNSVVSHVKNCHDIEDDSRIKGAIVKIDWRSSTPKTNNKIILPLEEDDPLLPAERQMKYLKDHERRLQEGVLFKCDICGKTANRKERIYDHKRRMHEDVKRFKCSICDWANYEINTVVRHVKKCHQIDDDSAVKRAIVKIDWRSSNDKMLKSIMPVEEDDLLTAEHFNYTPDKIIQATEQENPSEESIDGTWDCKICKKQYKLASQDNHLLHNHNLTLTEYLRIQSLNEQLNGQMGDVTTEYRPDSCLNLETKDQADITKFINWNVT